MSSATQSAIIWPAHFLPGTTDLFVTNEVIVSNLKASQIWPLLIDITKWSTYYANVSQITPPDKSKNLQKGDTFSFSTFGFPVLSCSVDECEAPGTDEAGRIAWSAKLDGSDDEKVEVYHAWLVEDLDGGRVRILTQESQKGKPIKEMAGMKPNRMLLGHQDWLDGLVKAAKGEKFDIQDNNLKAANVDAGY